MGLIVKHFSAGYEKRDAFDAGNAIVRNVSFSLQAGTITALAGSNGCGKTTLLKGLCGLIPASGTCILVNDKNTLSDEPQAPAHSQTQAHINDGTPRSKRTTQSVHSNHAFQNAFKKKQRADATMPPYGSDLRTLSPRRLARAVSYIPQRSGIAVPLPVIDVVLMGFEPVLHLLEQPGKLHREQARAALAAVGMAGYENHSFQTLSEGQKQLCILARTLVQDAPLLLLDEPDSALDFTNRHLLLDTLRRTVAERQRTCLLVLHDLSLALDCCDQLLLMESGQLTGIVHPRTDSEETLSSSLSVLCGPVRVFRRDGHCFLYQIKPCP